MADDGPVVTTNHLTKKYGELTALDDLSLTLDRGQILGLIGPNGAGKTTAIKILVGLARPTSGSASIAGVDCARGARKIKQLVGYMPDRFGSYDNMRVHEYLDFFGAAYGIPRAKRAQRIGEVLEMTNSTHMYDRFVETLSHGMQQRIGITRTLLHDPQVLILDEPANGLDPLARIEMRNLLLRLAKAGKTLIVTSHILPELSQICDIVAILLHGRLCAFGTLDEIMGALCPQRTIEVQLSSAERIESATKIIQGFADPETDVTSSTAEAVVRFHSSKPESEWGELLAQLIDSGLVVTQFRELQIDLEEAFLTVTRRETPDRNAPTAEPAAAGVAEKLA